MANYSRSLRISAAVLGIVSFVGLIISVAVITKDDETQTPLLVGLGDSYSSGLGGPPYAPGTVENQCFRSDDAYSLVAAQTLGYQARNVACAGATIEAFTQSFKGEQPQVSGIGDADYVVMTMGGNDVGALQTLTENPANALTPQFLADFRNVALPALKAKLATGYEAVRTAAPEADVIVLGYPNVFPSPSQGFGVCEGLGPFLGQLVATLPVDNIAAAANELNITIRDATVAAGFEYVDPSPEFAGHGLCDVDRYIWGPTDAPSPEASLHPNEAGHRAMAASLRSSLTD